MRIEADQTTTCGCFTGIKSALTSAASRVKRLFTRTPRGYEALKQVAEFPFAGNKGSFGKVFVPLAFATSVAVAAPKPQLFNYWEAWNMQNKSDYCAQLADVPVGNGANDVVLIAFNDFKFTTDTAGKTHIGYVNDQVAGDGQPFDFDHLKAAIDTLHTKGGKVGLSMGGATFGMSSVVKSQADADTLVTELVKAVKDYGFDQLDFDLEGGLPSGDLLVYFFHELKEKLPNTNISLTYPAMGERDAGWHDLLTKAADSIDFFQFMAYDYYWSGYDPIAEVNDLINTYHIPPAKIVWGLMPGAHDAPKEMTTVKDAVTVAQYVKAHGLGGVMLWDANRDTDHRKGQPKGKDTVQQDGQPDGTFMKAIAENL